MKKIGIALALALGVLLCVSAASAGTLISLKPYYQQMGTYDIKSVLACVYNVKSSASTGAVLCKNIATIGGYIDPFTLSHAGTSYCTPRGGLKLQPYALSNKDSIYLGGGVTSSRSGCGIVSIQTDGTPLGQTDIAIPAYTGDYLLVSEVSGIVVTG